MVKREKIIWDPLERRPLLLHQRKKNEKVLAFIQARTTSTRLPNKVYMDLNGAPMLYHVIARAKEAAFVDDVIVTSPTPLDLPEGIKGFVWGVDENDVLSRFAECLREHPCDYIVRLTADCPLLDPALIDKVVDSGIGNDYCSNVIEPTFPDGLDVEMLSAKMLNFMAWQVKDSRHREHVTSIVREDKSWQDHFDLVSIESYVNHSNLKLSVDTQEDLERARKYEMRVFQ